MLSSSVRHTVSRVADKMLSLLVELLGIFRISGYLNIGSLGLGAVILGLLRFISLDDCLNVAN